MTAELMQASYIRNPFGPSDSRHASIQATLATLDNVLQPYADSRMNNGERKRNLEEVLKRAALFAFTLFSQPSAWEFEWQEEHGVTSGDLCIFPALVQVADEAGNPVSPPRPFSEAVLLANTSIGQADTRNWNTSTSAPAVPISSKYCVILCGYNQLEVIRTTLMPTLTSMLPAAGLFLPETLHRADLPTQAPTETEGTRLKYFQRKIGRPKQEPRNSEDRRPSNAIPRETPDDILCDFPAIPTTYYFADYVLTTEKASADTIAFVSIIQQVRQDIDEATRLFISSAVSNFLDAYPNKRRWIETSLLEVRRALNEIGMDMDKAWGHDGDGGTAASKLKLEWGLRNQKKLLKKKQLLDQCHAQLTGAIYVMQTAELCGKPGAIAETPIFEAPVRPWVPHDEKDALRGPYSRQKYRTNQASVSASNITLASEAEKDDVEMSIRCL
ncbi:uncharacterized protein J4E84_003929 [Alternaria hordeiaustralica]|uniref:uncharacterized protein n=1 Tax=Alternaria hordeiaustralica TaxID=1187925 RepID=UPI0020C3BF6D|nr:uncharacterized protein J4E84_003929 [Alternaria hordeiaustralica]KAI4689749.1 hypothetical protein J4E84_003929 [Alternaria hordeiaustralica]